MSTRFEPVITADVAWTAGLPYAKAYDDIYFSADGGLQEAMHVFIESNRLPERFQALSKDEPTIFVIGETGFGTGLNFLLAWSVWDDFAPPNARLHFISCEKHPLAFNDLKRCLALWPVLSHYAEALMTTYPVLTPGYHRLCFDDGRVTLDLMLGDAFLCYQERLLCGDPTLEQQLRCDVVDAWFLDGFSPSKNPDMWSDKLFLTLAMLSTYSTTFSTFSAASSVKQGLRLAGFWVEKRPGYGQKRDMLTGIFFPKVREEQSRQRTTPWHVSSFPPIQHRQAIIVGSGFSGCCMANALARRGWQVRLLDSQPMIAMGASGNHQAILFPNVSAYRAPLTELMLSAFLYAVRFYKQCLRQWPLGELSGILQFLGSKKTAGTEVDLAAWLLAYPELGCFVDAKRASALAGVAIHSRALHIPMAGWIDLPALCERLLTHSGISFFPNTHVQSLERDATGHWQLAGHEAPVVIVANGHLAHQFTPTQHLSIKPIRGQMSQIPANAVSMTLKIPLCGEGHLLPPVGGVHTIGATFGLYQSDASCVSMDDDKNLLNIQQLPAHLNLSGSTMSHWAGIRASALDHLPLVGPVADAVLFRNRFASQATNAKRWVASAGDYCPGLYIATGFGARGLTTIPLCAEYLAGLLNREPSALPRHLVQAISPARFLHRDIKEFSRIPQLPIKNWI